MIDTNALRNKAVTLAIQGKLTEQLETDGCAQDIISFIKEEKSLLDTKAKSKKDKSLSNILEEEIPFDIPANWSWARLEDIAANIKNPMADGPFGSNLKREHYTEKREVRIIQLSNVGEDGWRNENVKYTTYEHLKTIERSAVNSGEIVIAKMMPAGRAIIVPDIEERYVLSSDCVKFVPHPKLFTKYVNYAINSEMFKKQVLGKITGVGRERTSLSKLKKYLIPIPPYEEQIRIVERISEIYLLLNIIDKLSDRYSLDIKMLRSKLIDESIQGRITAQLPEDGNSEDLYLDIKREKDKLIKEKKIKKDKELPEITAEEIPFDIPDNWKWVRLGDICTKISSGNTPAGGSKGGAYVTEGYCFFREQNVYNDGIHQEGMVYITEELLNTRENSTVLPKDILLNITGGSIGRCALIPDDFSKGSINQHILIIRVVDPRMRFYVHKCLCSPYYQKLIMGNVVGDKDGFSAGRCKNTLIPLPPIAEQKRIVERLENMLALI